MASAREFVDGLFSRGKDAQKNLVSIHDLKLGVWKNKEGTNIRIMELTEDKPPKCKIYSSDLMEANEIFGNKEGLRKKLEDGGYVFEEIASRDVAPGTQEAPRDEQMPIGETSGGEQTGERSIEQYNFQVGQTWSTADGRFSMEVKEYNPHTDIYQVRIRNDGQSSINFVNPKEILRDIFPKNAIVTLSGALESTVSPSSPISEEVPVEILRSESLPPVMVDQAVLSQSVSQVPGEPENVVAIDEALVGVGSERVPEEVEAQNKLNAEGEEVLSELFAEHADAMEVLAQIGKEIQEGSDEKDKQKGKQLLKKVTKLHQAGIVVETALAQGKLTETSLSEAHVCVASLKVLFVEVQTFLNQLKQKAGVGNAALGHAGNLAALLRARTSARSAEVPETTPVSAAQAADEAGVPKKLQADDGAQGKNMTGGEAGAGENGGPQGPEGPSFDAVLDGFRTEIIGLIKGIATPEDYVNFRKGMDVARAKNDRPEKRYFISLRTIEGEGQLGRKMTDAEWIKKQILEEGLEKNLREKFFDLKDVDLATQYEREQTEVIRASTVEKLDALEKKWQVTSNITPTWSTVFEGLTEYEKKKVSGDYQECSDRLFQTLGEKRAGILLQDFLKRPEGKKIIDTYRQIIMGEWQEYERAVRQKKPGVSEEEILNMWHGHLLSEVRKVVVEHLAEHSGAEGTRADAIIGAVIRQIENESQEQHPKKKR